MVATSSSVVGWAKEISELLYFDVAMTLRVLLVELPRYLMRQFLNLSFFLPLITLRGGDPCSNDWPWLASYVMVVHSIIRSCFEGLVFFRCFFIRRHF